MINFNKAQLKLASDIFNTGGGEVEPRIFSFSFIFPLRCKTLDHTASATPEASK